MNIGYRINGREVTKEEWDRLPNQEIGEPGGHEPGCWPKVSIALEVHPGQRQEAIEDARRKGVPTDFNERGQPIFTDQAHEKKYHQAYGYFNRNAGYSDAQRGSFKGDLPDRPDVTKQILETLLELQGA